MAHLDYRMTVLNGLKLYHSATGHLTRQFFTVEFEENKIFSFLMRKILILILILSVLSSYNHRTTSTVLSHKVS